MKWIEAKLLAHITKAKVRVFVWKAIICQLDWPQVIIMNNARQFNNARFDDFHTKFGITHSLTLVGHARTNREAKMTNQTLLQDLKVCLD